MLGDMKTRWTNIFHTPICRAPLSPELPLCDLLNQKAWLNDSTDSSANRNQQPAGQPSDCRENDDGGNEERSNNRPNDPPEKGVVRGRPRSDVVSMHWTRPIPRSGSSSGVNQQRPVDEGGYYDNPNYYPKFAPRIESSLADISNPRYLAKNNNILSTVVLI
ncbi:hypothetical protein EDC01DRAFT_628288 [Geopyxis carbonaria]|nr:hypothetical protein EDC01DRAFT_628288 [Geopyxis carbonaria]